MSIDEDKCKKSKPQFVKLYLVNNKKKAANEKGLKL